MVQKKVTSIYHGVCCSGSVLFSTGGESWPDFVPLRRWPGQYCSLTLTQAQLEHSVRIPSITREQSTPNINGRRLRSAIPYFFFKKWHSYLYSRQAKIYVTVGTIAKTYVITMSPKVLSWIRLSVTLRICFSCIKGKLINIKWINVTV